MSNSVIFRAICTYLPMPDLINCRLVSKLWHWDVNSAMHRSNIAIKISWRGLLSQVEELNVLIPKMNLPFNGLSFMGSRLQENTEDSVNGSLNEFLEILPPIKHLYFNDSSASEKLILRIMESNANHLETLSIYNTGINVPNEILGAVFQLKKLRKTYMTTYSSASGHSGNLIAVLKNCETLESVEGIAFHDLSGVPEFRWHVIKRFELYIDDRPFNCRQLDNYLQVVPARCRFTSLTINCWYSSRQETQALLNLANSCKDTLTNLRLALGTLTLSYVNDLLREALKLRSLILDAALNQVTVLNLNCLAYFLKK